MANPNLVNPIIIWFHENHGDDYEQGLRHSAKGWYYSTKRAQAQETYGPYDSRTLAVAALMMQETELASSSALASGEGLTHIDSMYETDEDHAKLAKIPVPKIVLG